MEPEAPDAAPPPPPPPPPARSPGVVVAWVAILLVTALVIGLQQAAPPREAKPDGGGLEQAIVELQAKYLVGMSALLGDQAAGQVVSQLEQWQPKEEAEQIRVAILAGELSGPEAALKRLREAGPPLSDKPRGVDGETEDRAGDPAAGRAAASESDDQAAADETPSEKPAEAAEGEGPQTLDEPSLREILIRLYQGYEQNQLDAPLVTASEESRLEDELGWFGQLALAPPDADDNRRQQVLASARRTVSAVIGGVTAAALAGLAGLILLVVYLVYLPSGKLSRLAPPSGNGGVYVETFAIWLVLFLAFSIVGGLLFGGESLAAASMLPMLGSLLALAWPLRRGVCWRQLRSDIGLTRGRGLLREAAAGVGCYLMALPLLVIALIFTATLVGAFQGPADGNGAGMPAPVHPAAEMLADAGPWQLAQLLLLACVAAPIVEETVFRGLLYRHLREATAGMRQWATVLISAVVTGLIFAAIHPQGLLAVPGILGIAVSLAFVREWRDSLLAPMIGHALNNTVTMLVLLSLLGS